LQLKTALQCLKKYIFALRFNLNKYRMSEVMTDAKPITLTIGAVKQLQRIKTEQNIPDDYGLRVGVKGGGCSGFSYMLGFDEIKDNDSIYEIEGIKVLMQKSHAIYLLGMEIDWQEGLQNRGFAFNNPNAKDTCGCGTSFSA
jgi:iron-sulfur cluster assembly protein